MCQHERIAAQGSYFVDLCGCDRVTLSIGPVSMRLDRAAFEELARFLTLAQRRLVLRDEHGPRWREILRAPDLENGP